MEGATIIINRRQEVLEGATIKIGGRSVEMDLPLRL